ncbi:GNAT family N-acetyltransferase [Haloarchaeobius litoreus]|uniref:GNAT family N-acetyltransferase n=1 Tax=Haloarchaeobius litoreus TaxID=755306 RepID=A0ABD6DGH9_9EURY|nr:GNAT family N-acetyltransferase [Haloarchaeobius litoreus]
MDEVKQKSTKSGLSAEWHAPEPSRTSDRPPKSFLDARGRYLQLTVGHGLSNETYEALVEMYDAFDPTDRAHGLPPLGTDTIRDWLDNLGDGLHVVARHDGRVVGHAVLVAARDGDAHELAIFVLGEYQHARVGTRVLERFCWEADHDGIPAISLYVESSNRPALNLYRSMGFSGEYVGHGELEMRLDL